MQHLLTGANPGLLMAELLPKRYQMVLCTLGRGVSGKMAMLATAG